MKWYNFKALSINTTLNSKALLASEYLESFINDLQANTTMYHCYYDVEKRDTLAGYAGLIKPVFDTIHFDLDSKDDEGRLAWEQTKLFCKRLQESGCNFHLYFSGNKGFHVAIHMSALGVTGALPHDELSSKIKGLLYSLKNSDYSTLDTAIYDPTRKFRAYRSKHEKSGLYKIRLTDIGITKPSTLTIEEIRNLALTQPVHKYAHPMQCQPVDWLVSRFTATSPHPIATRGKVKEVTQGTQADDDSLKFRNFKGKACTKEMQDNWLPQFNRHDIGLRLIYEYRMQGLPIAEIQKKINEWAVKVFDGDKDRISDMDRMVSDAFSKPQDYRFGCYDPIKQAYCSAKCKLYNQLDRKLRAEPLDCTQRQAKENEVRRNEQAELSEGQIADAILGQMPELCKASGQYFQWEKTHWKRIDGPMFEDLIKKAAIAAYNNEAGIRQVKNLAEHILAKIPMAPESNHFFSSSPNKFNFTDCTAVIEKSIDGKLNLVTREHKQSDYLSYCAPFPLRAESSLPRGDAFNKYLSARDDVGPEGIRIIKQMLGAALIPYAPRIFFIEGVTNSGKSTLALLIKRLLGRDNVSEVQPVIKRNGSDRFNWEPSIGKLANIVLELDASSPLDTTVLKMVRDKTNVSVDRKGKTHVQATLPFFHVYCCNEMPPSLEGNSGALNNRVSMLYFKPGYLNGSSGILELADQIWDNDAGGVLEAAREGLADLVNSGFHYYENEASKQAVKNWQKTNDSIALFLEDIQKGEFLLEGLEGVTWERGSVFYVNFRTWCGLVGKKPMGKNNFYEKLRGKFKLECDAHAKGGVRFRISEGIKIESDTKTTPKSSMISEGIGF
jgi:phage/plasmid-associated DNA primase